MLIALGFIASIYFFTKSNNNILLGCVFISVILFFTLIKIHLKVAFERKLNKALIDINQNEINFIDYNTIPQADGIEYTDSSHAYSFDLDIFGSKSLFHTLNRTATYIGKHTLAKVLLRLLPNKSILQNQEAIKELANDVEWRNDIHALATVTSDDKTIYESLIKWSKSNISKTSKILTVYSYISPVTFFISMVNFISFNNSAAGNLSITLFMLNLIVTAIQGKIIKNEIIGASKIDTILKNYSLIFKQIELKDFQAEKLNELKQTLIDKNGTSASAQIKKLSYHYGQLENIQNLVVAVFLNGAMLYHTHVLRTVTKWKTKYAPKINDWLNVIGAFEALNSLANFSFNNPKFAFAELNSEYNINIKDLGHPLINKDIRVTNNTAFIDQKFVILTGSNMSGKSTFLRSLGVNMILAGIGAPICAAEASIHPLKTYVSMRMSDSLNDGESYFFAEVKRLKEIMDNTEKEISFVLLDEILRGTNSDDKREGTVEVVKKIISKNAIGIIATHDLKVCDTTNDYPQVLSNKCFEVEIINNELSFDYKLRDGICKNKSATFLMKKMEVI
jgi:DNA mismatch repair ATPase MutS